ncbi:MAG: hypothetical protein AAB381_02705 [Patescibacteria group bacterium]
MKNTISARGILITGGPSREDIRDALGVGGVLRFRLDIPKNQPFPYFPLEFVQELEVSLQGLLWRDPWCRVRKGKTTRCVLYGEFGPLQEVLYGSVYWGKFLATYDTSSRRGFIRMRFSWESVNVVASF